jgi:hypothetical protein
MSEPFVPRPRESERGVPTAWTILIAAFLLAIVALIAVPRWLEARKHGNEAHAIGALKTIATSEAIFRENDKEHDGNLDYGMLSELERAGLLDDPVGAGTKRGYFFQASYSFSTSEFLWFAVANPENPGITGGRYFFSNQAGVIFYSTTTPLPLDTNSCTLPNPQPPLYR